VRAFTLRSLDCWAIGANYGAVLGTYLPGTLGAGCSLVGVKVTYTYDTTG